MYLNLHQTVLCFHTSWIRRGFSVQRVIGFSSSTSTGELCSSFTGQCTEGATMRRRDSLRQITACPHSQVDTVSRVLGESLLPCEPVPSLGKQNPPELPCLAAKLGSCAFHPNIAPLVGLSTKAWLLMYHVIVFFLFCSSLWWWTVLLYTCLRC